MKIGNKVYASCSGDILVDNLLSESLYDGEEFKGLHLRKMTESEKMSKSPEELENLNQFRKEFGLIPDENNFRYLSVYDSSTVAQMIKDVDQDYKKKIFAMKLLVSAMAVWMIVDGISKMFIGK